MEHIVNPHFDASRIAPGSQSHQPANRFSLTVKNIESALRSNRHRIFARLCCAHAAVCCEAGQAPVVRALSVRRGGGQSPSADHCSMSTSNRALWTLAEGMQRLKSA
jgi:hypothetical protein